MSKLDTLTIFEIGLLHSKADRAFRLTIAGQLEPYGITMMQWLLLATVSRGPDTGTKMSDLAAALSVTMPQITALMNDLTKMKLVKQKINQSDRRSRRLIATPQGNKLVEKLEPEVDKGMKTWFKTVGGTELDGYISTLTQLAA